MGWREQVIIGLWAALFAFGLLGFPIFAKGMGGALGRAGRGLEVFLTRISEFLAWSEGVLVLIGGLLWVYARFDVRGLAVLGLIIAASLYALRRMYGPSTGKKIRKNSQPSKPISPS